MAKNKNKKAIVGAAAIVAAGLGLWYAIKSGLFGGGNSKGGNTYYYYTTSDGSQQSTNSWQDALINAGSQISVELINLIKEISQGKKGTAAETDLKQAICDDYGLPNPADVTDADVQRYSNFLAANGRKPTMDEFLAQIWI